MTRDVNAGRGASKGTITPGMRNPLRRVKLNLLVLAIPLIFSLAAIAAAQTVGDIEKKLKTESALTDPNELAVGKRMLIRNFYSDSAITYDDQGKAIEGTHIGSWLGDGYVEVETMQEVAGHYEIIAKRLRGTFDKKARLRFKESKEKVVLKIPNKQVLSHAFLARNDELVSNLPLIWRRFLTGTSPFAEQTQIRRVGGGVEAPRPNYTPEPSPAPPKGKYEGTVSLTALVETDGTVHNVEIFRPVGSGLDEKAAEAVAKWRFTPAMYKKQPVPVRIMIDVNFNLY